MNDTNERSVASAGSDAKIARLRLQAAHAEIELLRTAIRRLAEQDATLSVQGGNVTVTMEGTLAEEEVWAVGSAMVSYAANKDDEDCVRIRLILRDLMRRLM